MYANPVAPVKAQAQAPLTIEEKIEFWATQYGVDPQKSLAVAKCESGLNPEAVGDHGKAYGLYQFWEGTFNKFASELGEKMDYHNPDDQIKLANWAFSKGYGLIHWTCWDGKVVKKPDLTPEEAQARLIRLYHIAQGMQTQLEENGLSSP